MIKLIFKWLKIVFAVLLLCLVARCQYINHSQNRLPTDKEMLEHFNRHRVDFEKLVLYHQQYDYLEQVKPGLPKLNNEEKKVLLNQAGVKRVYGTFWGWGVPQDIIDRSYRADKENSSIYHEQPFKSVDNVHSTFYKHPYDGAIESPEQIKKLKREVSAAYFLDSDVPLFKLAPITDLTRIIEIELAEPRYSIFFTKRKVYMHFPRPPIIQNNQIMVHTSIDGYLYPAFRIVDSLYDPPTDWYGDCLLKPIDTVWFISLYDCAKPVESNS